MPAPRVLVLGDPGNETNVELVAAWTAQGLDCAIVDDPRSLPRDGHDVLLGRIDVSPTLDGVEPGLLELLWAERRGAAVLNRARALLTTHDKLRTAVALNRAHLPHPRTSHVPPGQIVPPPTAPVVLKPRFGSWGRDVRLCLTDAEVDRALRDFGSRPWFLRHGVLVQEAIPSRCFDLRLLVAGGRVVGAVERLPRQGEWRTNVSIGAAKRTAVPDSEACALAVAAASAVGADLASVDVMPLPESGYAVIEVNGAADFDEVYRPDGDVYAEVADALGLGRGGSPLRRGEPPRAGQPLRYAFVK